MVKVLILFEERLVRRNLYAGQIFVKTDNKSGGYFVRGLNEPLVSESLFKKVQDTIEENLNIKKFVKAKSFKPDFALRGLLVCDNCEHNMTGSSSRSKTGKLHGYYHCNHCGKVRITTQEVNTRIDNILSEISISKNAKDLYDMIIKKLLSESTVKKRSVESITEEIKQLQLRIQNAEDSYSDGNIDVSVFHNMNKRYQDKMQLLKDDIDSRKNISNEYSKYLKKGIDLLSDMKKFYNSSDIATKRQLLSSIFPEKIIFSKEKSRTPIINQALLLILNTSRGCKKNETGQPFQNIELSRQVELQGPQFSKFN